MDLVVARDLFALRIEYQRGIQHASGFRRGQRQCAANHPDAMASRGIREKALDWAVAVGFAHAEFVRVLEAHEAEVFGQQDELGAVGSSLGDEPFSFGEIAFAIRRADHLQGRHAKRRTRGCG